MGVQVNINSITGSSPFDIYICQSGGTNCFYMSRIENVPFSFEIPYPYNQSYSYMLKIIDNNGSTISGTSSI